MNSNTNDILICENCGGDQFDKIFCGGDKLLGIDGYFCISQCKTCDIYLLSPKITPEEMEKYYPEDYICYLDAIEDENKLFTRINRKIELNKRCKQISKRVEIVGSILDIGCATGIFLDGMSKLGWNVVGIEPNREAADYARKRFNLDIYNGYLDQANLSNESFDVITLWDVLEHVQDPNSFIKDVYRLLKPGGLLVGTTPNANAWERYLFGEYWVGWEIPRHYRVHTPETISTFLRDNSFVNIDIFSFLGRHGAFMLSVQFWLNTQQTKIRKNNVIKNVLGSLSTRILTHPFFLIAEKLNRSNIMSFSAQKPK